MVRVSENVSAILQHKLPPKCKDPGSFTIPCVIGNTKFKHAMLDLGASINVMPYSIYASMNLGELKNDGVIIQLADRSNAYPKGVLENVLVQVGHLIFPADFYVLDMDESTHSSPMPILLGRPFMKTASTKIDVAKGALTMEFDGEMINFNVCESVDVHSCFLINMNENVRQEHQATLKHDASQTTNEEGIVMEHKEQAITPKPPNLAKCTLSEIIDQSNAFEGSLHSNGEFFPISQIPISSNRVLPSLVQVPNQIRNSGSVYIDFGKLNATIWEHHYPLPYIDPTHEHAVGQVVEELPFQTVASNGE